MPDGLQHPFNLSPFGVQQQPGFDQTTQLQPPQIPMLLQPGLGQPMGAPGLPSIQPPGPAAPQPVPAQSPLAGMVNLPAPGRDLAEIQAARRELDLEEEQERVLREQGLQGAASLGPSIIRGDIAGGIESGFLVGRAVRGA